MSKGIHYPLFNVSIVVEDKQASHEHYRKLSDRYEAVGPQGAQSC